MWSGKKELSRLDAHALRLINSAEPPRPEYQVIRLHTGEPVPALVCSLLAGLIDSQEALEKVMKAFDKDQLAGLNKSDAIQLERILRAFFNPNSLSLCMKPIDQTAHLIKRCLQNPYNKLYVLSNWDTESFIQFSKTASFHSVLSAFDYANIMISADIGYIKPQPEMYEYFLDIHGLDAQTCFFIDDQEENVAGAQTFGIDGFKFNAYDHGKLEDALRNLHIID